LNYEPCQTRFGDNMFLKFDENPLRNKLQCILKKSKYTCLKGEIIDNYRNIGARVMNLITNDQS
jgi:hypothetical protein